MRKIKITEPTIEGGYIASSIGQQELRNLSIEAWTQFYHKPYCLDDWGEARGKAKARKYRILET